MHAAVAFAFFLAAALLGCICLYVVDPRALRPAIGTVAVFSCALVYVAAISHL